MSWLDRIFLTRVQSSGTPLPVEPTINFTGAGVSVADDSANARTTVTIAGGAGVTSVTASAPLASSGGVTPNITITSPLPITNGGTGQATQQAALDAVAGAVTSGDYLRGNGTHVVMSAIQAGDVPTLNQSTTGTASNVTGTVAIGNGGTGQTTANNALNALLPTQGSSSGKFLTTNGTNSSWGTPGGGGTSTYFGVYGSRTAPGTAGALAYCTDSPVSHFVDDGSAWRPVILGQYLGNEPPSAAGFTAVNQGGSALTQLNGALLYTGVNEGASLAWRGYVKTATSVTAVLAFLPPLLPAASTYPNTNTAYTFGGAFLRESGTGKLYGLGLTCNVNNGNNYPLWTIELEVWSSVSTRTVSTVFALPQDWNGPLILQVAKSGSNVVASIMRDVVTPDALDTRAQTSPFTTAPDQAGIGGFGFSATPKFTVTSLLLA